MTSNERHASVLAARFRSKHRLALKPIGDIFELISTYTDFDILSMDAAEEEHGLSMRDPQTRRVAIAVATTPHPMRQRSSAAHELGHVLAGDLDVTEAELTAGERSPTEIRADAFARHLLLPVGAVRERLTGDVRVGTAGLEHLSLLVQEYGVSPSIAAIQLRAAEFITPATCHSWSTWSARDVAARFGWLTQYQALAKMSMIPRAPQTLMARAIVGVRLGLLSITELARWYGQDPTELRAELEASGALPRPGSEQVGSPAHNAEPGQGGAEDDEDVLFPDDMPPVTGRRSPA